MHIGKSAAWREETALCPRQETDSLIRAMLTPRQAERIDRGEDADFCYALPDGRRQRVNVYRERGRLCAAVRLLNDTIPTLEELRLPSVAGAAGAAPQRPDPAHRADRQR